MNALSPPDPVRLAATAELCTLSNPYCQDAASDALFVRAMREICAWHIAHCPFYARLAALRSFAPERLETVADCATIPPIHANFFKQHEVLSIDRAAVKTHLTSSGTTGQKSQMFFDAWSLGVGQDMVARIFDRYGWHTPDQPVNYLIFNYEPVTGSKVGTAFTNQFLARFAPVNRVGYALRHIGGGRHEYDPFGCIRILQEYAEEGLPVRLLGFPAFLHATLSRMQALELDKLRLNPQSLVFFGGGWKKDAQRAVPKTELYALIEEWLGIPNLRIRDGYGAVEHSVPYIECDNHRLHVPSYSRVFARDVATLEPLGPGQTGFLHAVSPYITSVPAHSVLMGDLMQWRPGEECGCSLRTPYFELLGRAGASKNRSCAMAAAELLK
jgi:phenylacetate-coenzyme A ligase PaaK-like adenylate-forming protein